MNKRFIVSCGIGALSPGIMLAACFSIVRVNCCEAREIACTNSVVSWVCEDNTSGIIKVDAATTNFRGAGQDAISQGGSQGWCFRTKGECGPGVGECITRTEVQESICYDTNLNGAPCAGGGSGGT